MNRRYLLPLAFIAYLITACRSEQETAVAEARDNVPTSVKGEMSTTERPGNAGRSHGYVRRLYQEKGQYYVTVDYIQFLHGADAVAAAQHKGDASVEVQNGDTIYSVFNDYYIVNDDPRTRTLRLSDQAAVVLWDKSSTLRQYTTTPAEALTKGAEVFRFAPFVVEVQQGTVVRLSEQYVP